MKSHKSKEFYLGGRAAKIAAFLFRMRVKPLFFFLICLKHIDAKLPTVQKRRGRQAYSPFFRRLFQDVRNKWETFVDQPLFYRVWFDIWLFVLVGLAWIKITRKRKLLFVYDYFSNNILLTLDYTII